MKPLLKIRDAQMTALTDVVVMSWLRGKIETLYPVQSAAMGREGLERFVTAASGRAHRYGFTSRDYLSYLSLEMTFGENFMEEDWARQAFEGEADTAMQRLRHEAIFLLAKQAEDAERQEEADQAVPPPDEPSIWDASPVGDERSIEDEAPIEEDTLEVEVTEDSVEEEEQ